MIEKLLDKSFQGTLIFKYQHLYYAEVDWLVARELSVVVRLLLQSPD